MHGKQYMAISVPLLTDSAATHRQDLLVLN
jgi:hypothetical protein